MAYRFQQPVPPLDATPRMPGIAPVQGGSPGMGSAPPLMQPGGGGGGGMLEGAMRGGGGILEMLMMQEMMKKKGGQQPPGGPPMSGYGGAGILDMIGDQYGAGIGGMGGMGSMWPGGFGW
jgi:hypothetical protein